MEDRRKGDRRKLYGKPFLAMLIGGLPEDRRKGQRRATTEPTAMSTGAIPVVRGDFTVSEALDTPR